MRRRRFAYELFDDDQEVGAGPLAVSLTLSAASDLAVSAAGSTYTPSLTLTAASGDTWAVATTLLAALTLNAAAADAESQSKTVGSAVILDTTAAIAVSNVLLAAAALTLGAAAGFTAISPEFLLAAPDRQATWGPAYLVECTVGATTYRWTDGDLDALSNFYEGRLLRISPIRRKTVDAFWGPVEFSTVEITLDDADGALAAIYPTADPRGAPLVLKRYDRDSGFLVTEWVGLVSQPVREPGRLTLRGANLDLSVFEAEIPSVRVTTAAFPNAIDVGKTIPKVFGTVARVPGLLINHDDAANRSDYLVTHDTATVPQVFRSGPGERLSLVAASEYSVSTALYPGYTVIRFPVLQLDFQGNPHRVFADTVALATDRNPAYAVKRIFNDPTWGLNKAVNAASFDTAATTLTNFGGLFVDGVLDNAKQAQEWLRSLFLMRGMRPALNAAGEWTLTVDKRPTDIFMDLSDGVGDGERTLLSATNRRPLALEDMARSVRCRYRRDYAGDDFLFDQVRQVASVGREVPHEFWCVRDHETMDRVADYLSKRMYHGQELVDVTATQEARQLVEGHLVQLTSAPLSYAAAILEVQSVDKELTPTGATLRGFSSTIYQYTAGTLPADNLAGTFSDYSRTPPAAATSLSVASSGTERASNGEDMAFVILQFTTPTTNYGKSIVRHRKNGATVWSGGATTFLSGAGVQVKIPGLVQGQSYDYTVQIVNAFEVISLSDPVLLNQTAPGDTTAPAVPTGLAVSNQKLTTITFTWVAPADKDVRGYNWDVRTAAAGGGSVVVSGYHEGTTLTIDVASVGYAATRYFRVAAVDYTGNVGTYTASVSFVFSKTATGDIGDSAVDSLQLASLAVVSAKIGSLAVQNAKIDNLAVDTAQINSVAVTTAKRQAVNSYTQVVTSLSTAVWFTGLIVQSNAVNSFLGRVIASSLSNLNILGTNTVTHNLGTTVMVTGSIESISGEGSGGTASCTVRMNYW